jgi:1-acyl-sn-glycerol-3-phosphate acyltransferase
MPVNDAPYRVSAGRMAVRSILRGVIRLVAHSLTRVTVIGAENVPLGTPYLAAQNHISIFDPPYAAAFWPETLEAIGASDIWGKPTQKFWLQWYGVTQVHRGEYDRELIDTILRVLRSGRPLLIAPEGGRSHVPGLRRAKPGVGFLIEATQVPVVPVGLVGTTEDMLSLGLRGKRPSVTIRIGEPFTLPPIESQGTERRLARQRNADLVMAHIAGLLPESYWGVYADQAILPGGSQLR